MRLHLPPCAIGHRERVYTESLLGEKDLKNTFPHLPKKKKKKKEKRNLLQLGIEPASLLLLAFQSGALIYPLSCHGARIRYFTLPWSR